ncbi:alpha/beta fold hydrolase [Fulvivirga sedimenti]|uniref:Alpha/beta hydrolase n=1 Tax=Fulvivirga sedimenti TaxID=2879465 RepID=A0A9X1HTT4_9BACT|nr:alpha/beta hydrolase [Fulvivirga sedimenti]MCA6075740.1 alpha/beta hydrolase [Fulvivirga sedimenti]MCA6076868.1 alpha/beta hydrolase [Fulvivirga sedimenti]
MLHYKIINQDSRLPWAVFIHGAGGSIETWKYQTDAYQEHFRVLLLDLRDHGKSQSEGKNENSYTFELISSDILEVLFHLGIQRAVFISLSFGSVLLQDLSMRAPGMVRAAVMAGAIFRGNVPIRLFVAAARLFNVFLPYRMMYSMFSYLLMPKDSHQRSRRIYRLQARKIDPEAYLRWVTLYDEFFRLLTRFWNQQIEFPVMVVMGSDDYVFLKTAREFASKNRRVMIHEIDGAGHICNIDDPKEFNQISLKFLRSSDLLFNVPVEPGSEIKPEY